MENDKAKQFLMHIGIYMIDNDVHPVVAAESCINMASAIFCSLGVSEDKIIEHFTEVIRRSLSLNKEDIDKSMTNIKESLKMCH